MADNFPDFIPGSQEHCYRDELKKANYRWSSMWNGWVRCGYETKPDARQNQVGGDHYKNMIIQPAEYVHKNGIGFLEGTAIAYLSRWRSKNGLEDLKKAKHTLELLIEMESE